MVSLLAITLSTGILVDDAIVEIENIARHMRMGKTPYQAALDATNEIGLAVIAISFTIVAVFIPASFLPSIPGQFFKQFGVTVSVQVMFSLLCARMITPMLAAYFLIPHRYEGESEGRIMTAYSHALTWAVKHRFLTVAAGLLFSPCRWQSRGVTCKSGFCPRRTIRARRLTIELPPGSQLADTEA